MSRKSMLQSAVIWSIGDTIAQYMSFYSSSSSKVSDGAVAAGFFDQFDTRRTLIAASYGGLVFTPIASRWYQHVVRLFPQTTLPSITRRVLADQLLWSPVALAIYFSTMSLVHLGPSIDAVHDVQYKIGTVLPPTLVTNWMFWMPLQFVNFFFVAPHRWILTVNLAAIPWTAYLSYMEAK
ncbi:membrane-associated protein, putative [Bodo saltans]|uniref:Membrane-associated protein, putative n=1 Tax=Bodo saltans TaxID=75058 RepID=A0A0S4IW51_BODSA|nr:membrane-associated protein, putative [Bodo saltans]|eukprot:CUG25248.1 membrane-associated protein, putative [Bodo saltans]